jgi:hypothetical protein
LDAFTTTAERRKIMLKIEEIKVREQAATPGPWEIKTVHHKNKDDAYAIICPSPLIDIKLLEVGNKELCNFISNSRTDIPALIAEVETCNEQHRCDVYNIAAMQNTIDQQAKNCEKLLSDDKQQIATLNAKLDEINRYNISCTKEIDKLLIENLTLKKALELACNDFEMKSYWWDTLADEIYEHYVQKAQEENKDA